MPRLTIERTCPVCSSIFRVPPSRVAHGRGLHCSKACQYEARRISPKSAVTLVCEGCGDEYQRPPSVADKARFCTRECRDRHWVGELTPNWQDGSGVYKRGPNWHSIRRAILRRDNHECQECGETGDLHVHHKTPFRMFDDASEANDPDNLITLCPPCHRREDAKSKWVKLDGAIIHMNAGGYAWELARQMSANDNQNQKAAA